MNKRYFYNKLSDFSSDWLGNYFILRLSSLKDGGHNFLILDTQTQKIMITEAFKKNTGWATHAMECRSWPPKLFELCQVEQNTLNEKLQSIEQAHQKYQKTGKIEDLEIIINEARNLKNLLDEMLCALSYDLFS